MSLATHTTSVKSKVKETNAGDGGADEGETAL